MIDLETLIQTYLTLKEYIPAKDRQAAADNLMSELVDILDEQSVSGVAASDSYLRNAYKEYNPDEDLTDYGEDEYN